MGMLSTILAAVYPLWDRIRNGIVQELPPDEDTEFSERGRR